MDCCRTSFFSLSRFFYFIGFSLCAFPLQAYYYYSASFSDAGQEEANAVYIRTVNKLDSAWLLENEQIHVQDVEHADIDLSTSFLFIFNGGVTPRGMDGPAYSGLLALPIRAVLRTMADRRFHPVHGIAPYTLLRNNQQDIVVPVYQYGNLVPSLSEIGGLTEQLQQEGLIVDWYFRGLSFIDEARFGIRVRVSVSSDNSVADHHEAVLERFRNAFPATAIRYRFGTTSSRDSSQNLERAEPVSRENGVRYFDPGSVSSGTVRRIQFYLGAERRLAWEPESPPVQTLGDQLYSFLVRFHVNPDPDANELSGINPPWLINIVNFTRAVDTASARLLRWMLVRISEDAGGDGRLVLTFRMDISADPYEIDMAVLERSEGVSEIHSWSQLNINLHHTGPQPEQDTSPGILERLIRQFRRGSRQPEELQFPLPLPTPQLDPARGLHSLDPGSFQKMQ